MATYPLGDFSFVGRIPACSCQGTVTWEGEFIPEDGYANLPPKYEPFDGGYIRVFAGANEDSKERDPVSPGVLVLTPTVTDANGRSIVLEPLYLNITMSGGGTGCISWVSSPVVFESADSYYISACYDATAGKIVIAYSDYGNSGYGTAVVGTVSGTTISFGAPVVFESADSYYISACYDAAAGKIVIAYCDYGNSAYGTAVTLSITICTELQ